MQTRLPRVAPDGDAAAARLDAQLDGRTSRLVGWMDNAEETTAEETTDEITTTVAIHCGWRVAESNRAISTAQRTTWDSTSSLIQCMSMT